MRRFSAQLIITNSGPPLKRAVVCAEDDGTIISIEDNAGSLKESQSVEFYNGIIVPGFVNCHCHLELSHMKGAIPEGTGLSDFIMQIRNSRETNPDNDLFRAQISDKNMSDEGIVLCADVCNTSLTFEIKKKSLIKYYNLLEVFGIDPDKAVRRMDDFAAVEKAADEAGLPYSIVPHSVYSVSLPLFRLIKEKSKENIVTSIHFMETGAEAIFLSDHAGPLRKSYENSGLLSDNIQTPTDHISAVLNEVTSSGNLIFVHNTFAEPQIVRKIRKRGNTFWCLCPGSNMYIENKMPPVEMLMSEECEIVVGTDSLASNKNLSILSELKLISHHFPSVKLDELIRWATVNGARALAEDGNFGKIVKGKKPGLLLLENVDLVNFKLLPETIVTRLV
jgi:cytosine/adenosine deaminase-related metal-dependent hydrolase